MGMWKSVIGTDFMPYIIKLIEVDMIVLDPRVKSAENAPNC